MKKENLKKVIVPTMLVTIIVIIVFTIILKLQYKNYETIVNNTIVDIIAVVREKYPQVSEEEIISILQNKDTIDKNNENYKIIKKYGYKDNISYIRELEEKEKEIIKVDALAILIMGLIVAFIIIRRKEKHDAEIDELIIQLNKINNGDY